MSLLNKKKPLTSVGFVLHGGFLFGPTAVTMYSRVTAQKESNHHYETSQTTLVFFNPFVAVTRAL